jgi:outer membrane protein assembly factor BamB
MRNRILAVMTVCAVVLGTSRAENWPQFRGAGGSGVVEASKLPTEWSADKNVRWKVEVPGVAWSSPIIWGDKVFVTTAITDKQTKPSSAGGGGRPGGGRPGGGGFRPGGGRAPDVTYRWEVHCLDKATGNTLWKELAIERKPTVPIHRTNTYASETPVTDGERVYAYFGMIGLFCFDMSGKLQWKKELEAYPMMAGWGTGSSPVLDEQRIFIQCDNEQKSFIAAFNKKTGEQVWKVDRDEKSSWATPVLWKNSKRTELVAGGGRKVRSYDPATGKVLWELGGFGGRAAASPVAEGDLLIVGAGGGRGGRGGRFGGGGGGGGNDEDGPRGGGALFAAKAGASGDITLKEGATSNDGVAWSKTKAGPSMASPLLYKGQVYILEQRGGMLSAYDAKTGKEVYSKERINGARGFTASPWASDDKIYCLDDAGTTFVIQAGASYKLLGKNSLNEMFWSTPSASGGDLFLRGVDHLFCIKP